MNKPANTCGCAAFCKSNIIKEHAVKSPNYHVIQFTYECPSCNCQVRKYYARVRDELKPIAEELAVKLVGKDIL